MTTTHLTADLLPDPDRDDKWWLCISTPDGVVEFSHADPQHLVEKAGRWAADRNVGITVRQIAGTPVCTTIGQHCILCGGSERTEPDHTGRVTCTSCHHWGTQSTWSKCTGHESLEAIAARDQVHADFHVSVARTMAEWSKDAPWMRRSH